MIPQEQGQQLFQEEEEEKRPLQVPKQAHLAPTEGEAVPINLPGFQPSTTNEDAARVSISTQPVRESPD
jgi:hypothetical protein